VIAPFGISARILPQCESRRKLTNREKFRYWIFGPNVGFDPEQEARCVYCSDHLELVVGQELHEDILGNQWAVEQAP
jgi:hypothetical protein